MRFEPWKVLEGVWSVPHPVVSCLQFVLELLGDSVHPGEELDIIFVEGLVAEVQVVVVSQGQDSDSRIKRLDR